MNFAARADSLGDLGLAEGIPLLVYSQLMVADVVNHVFDA